MPVLEITDLLKQYVSPDGETTTVVDVSSFSMEHGALVGLRGASGSGKTTFLNLIAGILRADRGRVVIDGTEMTGCSESARDALRAQTLGYVFQTFNLLQGYSALENVLLGMYFGGGADTAYAEHLLERVGLQDRMKYRPRQLSVGQQQRVAVARALANKPKLVLADEPTGNLDPRHAHDALGLIQSICRETNAALLLVSHDPEILALFETVQDFADVNVTLKVSLPLGDNA